MHALKDMPRQHPIRGEEFCFSADCVRGRMLKTRVDASPDHIVVDAFHRGAAAPRWAANLQGRETMLVVREAGGRGAKSAPGSKGHPTLAVAQEVDE